MQEKILVVDDDLDIVNLLGDILEDEGYFVDKLNDGNMALNKIVGNEYDLIILDIMMPNVDGFEICKKVRDKTEAAIIFLSAKGKSIDKVIGLELGADDFITKPFDDNELIARVKAHLRRNKRKKDKAPEKLNPNIIRFKGIEINKNTYDVFVEGYRVDLSTKEFQILSFMMENVNIVLTRETLFNKIWGYDEYGDINTVTVHIKKLREKVDKEGKYIKTVWGAGYKFVGERQ